VAVYSLLHWLAPLAGLPLATALPSGARTFLGTTKGDAGRLAILLASWRTGSNRGPPPYQGGALTV
jgi:hypothetical protein